MIEVHYFTTAFTEAQLYVFHLVFLFGFKKLSLFSFFHP